MSWLRILHLFYGKNINLRSRRLALCALVHEALGIDSGTVRFSFSIFNTEEEIRYAIDAVTELVKKL
jgi:selenocysteine lyase/cysteine desulfurase